MGVSLQAALYAHTAQALATWPVSATIADVEKGFSTVQCNCPFMWSTRHN